MVITITETKGRWNGRILEEGGFLASSVPCGVVGSSYVCRSSRASASDVCAFTAFSQSRIRVGFGARRGGGWLVSRDGDEGGKG